MVRPTKFTQYFFANVNWNLLFEITSLSAKGLPVGLPLLRKAAYIGGGDMYDRVKNMEKFGLIEVQRVAMEGPKGKRILVTDISPTEFGVEVAKAIGKIYKAAKQNGAGQ
jgi:hypothetical protein